MILLHVIIKDTNHEDLLMRRKKKPNPGSNEAVDLGCTCPVLDNEHGRGFPYPDIEEPVFWITAGCPLHDQEEENDDQES